MIDKRFIEYKANSYREEPEPTLLAAGPSETMTDAGPARIELTGMATPDKTPRVGRAGVPYQAPSTSDITEPAKAMLDMGAATVKGATQGFIGLPGDIEGIGRLILGKMGVNVDETTALPTTEEVKTWLDKNLGSVGDGKNPYESVGETVSPGGQVKAAKTVAKGAKALAPKAAEMIINATEKTGVPVTGLGIVEKTTAKTSEWIDKDSFTAYMKQPKQLQGFRKSGPNKGFDEENYKHVEFVEVKFEDGTTHLDAIRGLNKQHAISRAFGNWDPVAVRPVPRAEVMKKDPDLVKEVDLVMSKKSGTIDASQQEPK